jgi:hypothetical protein
MARTRGALGKKTLARLAQAKVAAGAADADAPRAVPSLTRILAWHLDRADKEIAKGDAGDPAVITAAFAEARLTAQILAQYQAPRLSAIAVGGIQRKIVEVVGGLAPRSIEPPAPLALVPMPRKADDAA